MILISFKYSAWYADQPPCTSSLPHVIQYSIYLTYVPQILTEKDIKKTRPQLEKENGCLQRSGRRHREFWMLRTKAIASNRVQRTGKELDRFSVVWWLFLLWCDFFYQIFGEGF